MAPRRRLPLTLRAYRSLTKAAVPLTSAWLAWRLHKGKEHAIRLPERRGVSVRPRPEGALVWAHGASVGEVLAILPLMQRIQSLGFPPLLTSGTLTAARLMEERLPAGALHQFVPLDSPVFVGRFLDHWQPNLLLLVESELWPNLIVGASERGIPLILVNGRLSQRSFDRWRLFRGTAHGLLSRIDLCLAQTSDDAGRLAELGAPRVQTTGNLKFDVPPPPADAEALSALQHATRDRPVVLAASTHSGEDRMVIDAHRQLKRKMPGLLTIIAPRHPERRAEIAETAKTLGQAASLRSRGQLPGRNTDIYIADTIGELGCFYRLAPIVFMGGSLVRHGGQNPIEPAKLDSAILYGPHVSNFAAVYAHLNRAHAAALVNDSQSLARSIALLLDDPGLVRQMAATARATVTQLGGALDKTYSAIEPYLIGLKLRH